MIELKNVSKTLSGEKIFENISLRVGNGECCAIVCDDAQKCIILLSVISGAIGVSEGAVIINGYDIAKNRSKAACQIGYVPAEGALYENLSVEEFLVFAAEAKQISYERAAAKIKDACVACELEDKREKLISKLSYSARRRLLLAQALLAEPSVLIVGEPFDLLDAQTRRVFEDVALQLKERGASVVLVASNADGMESLADIKYTLVGSGISDCNEEKEAAQ